jgi:hypothetical protein
VTGDEDGAEVLISNVGLAANLAQLGIVQTILGDGSGGYVLGLSVFDVVLP